MRFLKREDDLERELRARRPEPPRELVNEIARMISTERRHGASRGARLGVAVALTAGMLAALGAFGGLSYAANGVSLLAGGGRVPAFHDPNYAVLRRSQTSFVATSL